MRVEVTAGLEENEIVILAPETNLVDGARVQPVLADENEHRSGETP